MKRGLSPTASASDGLFQRRAPHAGIQNAKRWRGQRDAHASASLFSVSAKIWLSAFSCSFSYSLRFLRHYD